VITTVFNEERHLREAIDSVAEQRFADYEIVVVDDGSTDGTPQILDTLDLPALRVFRGERRGRQAALNWAIARSTGKYVAVLDADDRACPERLETSVEYLDRHPDVGAIGSRWRVFIDDAGATVAVEDCGAGTDAEIRRALCRGNPMFHSSTMYRRELFDRVGGYDEGLACLEDWDLFVRLAPLCRLVNLDAHLAHKRRHRGQFFDGDAGGHRTPAARRARATILWRTVRHLDAPKLNLLRAARYRWSAW